MYVFGGLWFLWRPLLLSSSRQHVPQALAVHTTHHCAPSKLPGSGKCGPLAPKKKCVLELFLFHPLHQCAPTSIGSPSRHHASTHPSYQVQVASSGVLEACLHAALLVSRYVNNIVMTRVCEYLMNPNSFYLFGSSQ